MHASPASNSVHRHDLTFLSMESSYFLSPLSFKPSTVRLGHKVEYGGSNWSRVGNRGKLSC